MPIPQQIKYLQTEYRPYERIKLQLRRNEVRWVIGKLYLKGLADLRVPYRHYLYMGANNLNELNNGKIKVQVKKLSNGLFGNAEIEFEALTEEGKLTLGNIARVLGITPN